MEDLYSECIARYAGSVNLEKVVNLNTLDEFKYEDKALINLLVERVGLMFGDYN